MSAHSTVVTHVQDAQAAAKAAENQRSKALAEAQAEASAAIAKAEKEAAAALADARATAAQMAQEQERQAQQAAETARLQVSPLRHWLPACSVHIACSARESRKPLGNVTLC